jgi:hypothetical protein
MATRNPIHGGMSPQKAALIAQMARGLGRAVWIGDSRVGNGNQTSTNATAYLHQRGAFNWFIALYHPEIEFVHYCTDNTDPPEGHSVGIGGERTRDMLARFNRDVLSKNPTMVGIVAGINDITADLPAQTIVGNLIRMVRFANSNGAIVWLHNLDPRGGISAGQETERLAVNVLLAQYAATNPMCILIDADKVFSNADGTRNTDNYYDFVHWNSRGAHALASTEYADAYRMMTGQSKGFYVPAGAYDATYNEYGNILLNPSLTGSGGANGTLSSGTVATDWRVEQVGTRLGANPLATTNGSTLITVTSTAHGLATGQVVLFSGAALTNGIPAAEINTSKTITVVNANSYTINSTTAATSTASGGGSSIDEFIPAVSIVASVATRENFNGATVSSQKMTITSTGATTRDVECRLRHSSTFVNTGTVVGQWYEGTVEIFIESATPLLVRTAYLQVVEEDGSNDTTVRFFSTAYTDTGVKDIFPTAPYRLIFPIPPIQINNVSSGFTYRIIVAADASVAGEIVVSASEPVLNRVPFCPVGYPRRLYVVDDNNNPRMITVNGATITSAVPA